MRVATCRTRGGTCFALIAATAAGLALARPADAQVPKGWWVSAHFHATTGIGLSTGGIFFHHPTGAAPSMAVTGLGADLTGAGVPATASIGSNAVAIVDPAATMLYVAEITTPPAGAAYGTCDLHLVTLAGSTAVSDVIVATFGPFPSGTLQIAALARVPGTAADCIMAFGGFTIAGTSLGYLIGGSTPITIPIPVTGLPVGALNALAVDPTGTTIYAGIFTSLTSGSVVAIPAAGGTATVLATLAAGPSAIDVDPRTGLVYVACLGGPPNLYVVNPGAMTATPVPVTTGPLNALAFEEATGELSLCTGSLAPAPSTVHRATVTGSTTLLASPPASGWGGTAGLDINPDPARYGAKTPGPTFGVDWDLPPVLALSGLDGLPLSGNGAFSLSISSNPTTMLVGVIGVSPTKADPPFPIAGGLVHINPFDPLLLLIPVTGIGVVTLPAGLPTGFAGLELFLQGVFADSTDYSWTTGLCVKIL